MGVPNLIPRPDYLPPRLPRATRRHMKRASRRAQKRMAWRELRARVRAAFLRLGYSKTQANRLAADATTGARILRRWHGVALEASTPRSLWRKLVGRLRS